MENTQENKVLLITGGFSDFGVTIINSIYDDFDMIFLHCSHSPERYIEYGLKELDVSNKINILTFDFNSGEDVQNMVIKLKGYDKKITHFIHLPSPSLQLKKFVKISLSDFDKFYNVSFRSCVAILQYLLPTMVENKKGNIIIMLSDSIKGETPSYCSNYISTKYALWGLVNSLAVEYSEFGININAISPGTTNTKFFGKQGRMVLANNAKNSRIKRNLETYEIVGTVKYLFSSNAKSVSGNNIFINGGVK